MLPSASNDPTSNGYIGWLSDWLGDKGIEELHRFVDEGLRKKKLIELVSKLFPMSKNRVTLGDGGPSAFRKVEQRQSNVNIFDILNHFTFSTPNADTELVNPGGNENGLQNHRAADESNGLLIPGNFTVKKGNIVVIYAAEDGNSSRSTTPTPELVDDVPEAEEIPVEKPTTPKDHLFNVDRINSIESFVTTSNGKMVVPNTMIKAELKRCHMDGNHPEVLEPCEICKLREAKVKGLEEQLEAEKQEKEIVQRIASEWHKLYLQREWIWNGKTQGLQRQACYYKTLSQPAPHPIPVPLPNYSSQRAIAHLEGSSSKLLPPSQVIPAAQEPPHIELTFPKEEVFKAHFEARRKMKKEIVPPMKLHPSTDEYRKLLNEAVKNWECSVIYKDPRLTIRTSLFNPCIAEPMPQLVKNPCGAYLLYRKWRENENQWIGNQDIARDWYHIKEKKGAEYDEWRTRALKLFDEHLDQLKKGYIKVFTRKRKSADSGSSDGGEETNGEKKGCYDDMPELEYMNL